MNPERWRQIDELLDAALDQPTEQRAAFLTEACGGDEPLRREVESLLRADEAAENLLEAPVVSLAGKALAQAQAGAMTGREFGHYKTLSLLGAGGMGEVYLAQDTRLGRKVALKLLPQRFTNDAERLRRFEQEGRAASALNHPNIITIHEIGQASTEEGGAYYIVTEFIEGQTLRQQLAGGPLKLREAVEVALQAASALSAAHAAGIVHRDIKPENIMVRPDGYVKVLDFGLAKLTERRTEAVAVEAVTRDDSTVPGRVLGTLRYMSPEQARGLKMDARTDVFSLGVVLYEMLTGQSPFAGATTADVIAAVLEREPPPLFHNAADAPPALAQIVSRALRKDRAERYQTSQELLSDLKDLKHELEYEARDARAARSSGPILAQTTGAGAVASTQTSGQTSTLSSTQILLGEVKRHKRGVALALTGLIIAAVVLFIWLRPAHFDAARHSPEPAKKETILLAGFANQTGDPALSRVLRQGLAAQLEQLPFLQLYHDRQTQETLRLMVRAPDEAVTPEIGREICERRGIKALVSGSIAPLGQRYVVTLEVLGGQTGETLARVQVEAEAKEQALSALAQATGSLRERLRASLDALPKFEALPERTTASLEALRTYSQGVKLIRQGKELEAGSFYQRAVELDPNFARAWLSRSIVCYNTNQSGCASEYAAKAFALRDQVSELERFQIMVSYYLAATGELEKRIEVLKQYQRSFPNISDPLGHLSMTYDQLGQFDLALAAAREAVRLNPNEANPNAVLATAALRLNLVKESQAVLTHMVKSGIDDTYSHMMLFRLACLTGDEAAQQREIERLKGQADEYQTLDWQAQRAAFNGQRRQAQTLTGQALDLAKRQRHHGAAALIAATAALNTAAFRQVNSSEPPGEILALTERALAFEHNPSDLMPAGLALAFSGATAQAQTVQKELARRYPLDTLVNAISLPLQHAALALRKGQAAQALEHLRPVERYEASADFWPQYLRGLAYLQLRSGPEAAVEFQKILDHRSQSPLSPLWPLAHLGMARAAALDGDAARSRKAYEDFFALWRAADAGLPLLQLARSEYAGR